MKELLKEINERIKKVKAIIEIVPFNAVAVGQLLELQYLKGFIEGLLK